MIKKITRLKLLLLTLFTISSIFVNRFHFEMITSLVEVYAIFFLAQLFSKKLKTLAYVLSSIAFFLVLLNVASFITAGSYITYTMYNNLTNLSALGDSLPKYFIATILAAIVSFLPMSFNLFEKKTIKKVCVFYGVDLVYIIIFIVFNISTPIGSLINLKHEIKIADEKVSFLKASSSEKKEILNDFKKENVVSGVEVNIDNMNVIVIFTEGMSSQVLDINNNLNLNLTPNLTNFSKESGVLNVQNYYNHTAATFKGLRGQLYSAYQYQDGYEKGDDGGLYSMTNTPLVSLSDVLRDNGYVSNFINAEPEHIAFSNYLTTLGFDKVVTGKKKELVQAGNDRVLPDQNNYDLLFEKAKELSETDTPFFLSTYTFGTHVKLNGIRKYNDGKVEIYNRFHTMDEAFGSFWKKFKLSPMYDNTIVVFTTDHSTYPDPDYLKYFNEKYNPFLNKIPPLFYYPGNTQTVLNADGKNSLSLIPTILDILGFEEATNYFLGNSLFTGATTPSQYISEFGSDFYTTKNNEIEGVDNQKLIDEIMRFNKISLNN